MADLLYRLGRFAARRRWSVINAWIVIFALSGASYALCAGTISSSITIPGTPTAKVSEQLEEMFPTVSGGTASLVFSTSGGQPFTQTHKGQIHALLTDIAGFSGVKAAKNPFTIETELADQRQQIVDGRSQLDAGRTELAAAQDQLDVGVQQLTDAQTQLDAARSQAGDSADAEAQFAQQQQFLDAQRTLLTAQQTDLDSAAQSLTEPGLQLDLGSSLFDLSKNIRFVSEDGTAALATVQFTKNAFVVPPELKAQVVAAAADARIPGVEVTISNELVQGTPNLVGPGEAVGIVIAAVVLLVLLGTVLGAALPLISAMVGLGVALLAALSFSGLIEFTSITPLLAVMLGLAVGIDYSLFIINRHRSQLKRGMPLAESIGLANGTSGNAVVFAGTTVIVALLALNITGIPFLGLMGTVGAVSVAVAILVAISLTPAMLSLAGIRILRKRERKQMGDAAAIVAVPMSTGRAVLTIVAGVALLGVVALPALTMRLGLPDGSSEATSSSPYKTFATIADKFGVGQNGPLVVVADLPEPATGSALLQQQVAVATKIAAQHNVSAVAPIAISSDGTAIAFQIISTGGPSSIATEDLVHDLRNISPVETEEGAVTLGVAGTASAQIDISEKLGEVLPIYLAVVLTLSLIILVVVFRSILVPIIATAGFVLSLLATLGALTAVYQFGWLSAIFGVHDPAPILSFLPILEIGVLFGLAMDYQLFLVSGMRETYAHGSTARDAVQRGLRLGRPVVTAAALIMIAVFAGFIFSESATIRPIGFGLAFGVLLDAFIVRMLLIPAAMHLLGDAAWWIPNRLDGLLPNIDVEGASLEHLAITGPKPPHPASRL
ncbi:RND transporter [Cryobacterium adonitolivorans]|uniref:RND transporter n=1 Tax=Cryobacterium adonitolivorans TaxID=1259189 RepID=A0A4R8W781_9MICO|nr:MMPL family transporter [Cryobacterium adonitolivorans]TFC01043.1 RND transporter [Cryobacterium adonitolivorans]